MFIKNKYTTLYYRIIDNRLLTPVNISTYTETHHIVPRSLGGSDHPNNLVKLTAREHFICHRLLTKMVSGTAQYKMLEALSYFSNNHLRNIPFTSRESEIIRSANAVASSARNKGNQYWKYRQPDSNELRQQKSLKAKQSKWINNGTIERFTPDYEFYIQNGFTYGRLPFNSDWLSKIATGVSGKTHSPETRDKLRAFHTGKPKSDTAKQKMSIAAKNRVKLTCEYCNKMISQTNYTRWHGDNCKLRPHTSDSSH